MSMTKTKNSKYALALLARMKGYFEYRTHDAPESRNYWYVLGEKGAPEKEGEAVSPWNGEEAYLRIFTRFPMNCIIILQTTGSGNYVLILEDPQSGDRIMTYRQYSWEEVVAHAALFRGQSFKAALRILKSKEL